MKTLIDHGPFLPEDAMRAGLIDDLAYEDEVDDKVKLVAGQATHYIDMDDYRQVSAGQPRPRPRTEDCGHLRTGLIASGRSARLDPAARWSAPTRSIEYLRKARADSSVQAIVLRDRQPRRLGDRVRHHLARDAPDEEPKPLIASMSDVAASGGYYIAMPAHAIVAEPSTLTGSIGVVLTKFVIDGTLKKLGHEHGRACRAGRYADLYSPVRPFSPEERARVFENMQATYDTFVEKAAQGRNTTPERIDAIGQGRVWTGRQAKEIGLVDELGGLDRADRPRQAARPDPAGIGSRAGDLPAEAVVLRLLRSPFGTADGSSDAGVAARAPAIPASCRRSPRRCRSSAAASRWR